jgi:hypothetical protein
MIAVHEVLFGTVLKGSRRGRGELPFARLVMSDVGV